MAIRRTSSSRIARQEGYASFAAQPSGELEWATVVSTTGSPGTGTYASGKDTYQWWRFPGAGSITFGKGGVVDVMVVAGGAGGARYTYPQGREYPDTMDQRNGGGGGGVVWKLVEVTDNQTVSISIGGGGGVAAAGGVSYFGNLSKIGGGQGVGRTALGSGGGGGAQGVSFFDRDGDPQLYAAGFGGNIWGGSRHAGVVLAYDNSAVEYGLSRTDGNSGVENTGQGGGLQNTSGGSGLVIVRTKI